MTTDERSARAHFVLPLVDKEGKLSESSLPGERGEEDADGADGRGRARHLVGPSDTSALIRVF